MSTDSQIKTCCPHKQRAILPFFRVAYLSVGLKMKPLQIIVLYGFGRIKLMCYSSEMVC